MADFFSYAFMRNAFWAVLLITPLLGFMGTLVVDNKLAFFSDALGHSALTGIAIGALLGLGEPTVSMVLFSLVFAYLLNRIRRSQMASSDTIISVFSSTAIALGLALLSRAGQFSNFSAYLIGDILTIQPQNLFLMLGVFGGIVLFWLFCYNGLLAISVSPLMASTRGVKVKSLETLFLLAVAVVVTLSIRWVGILVINSLLILPAAAARNLARNVRQYHLLSVLFALFSGLAGLFGSWWLSVSAGPAIVLVGAALFFVSFALRAEKV